MKMEEKFTGTEQLAITAAKLDIKAAKKRIKRVEDARRAREEIARKERVAARLRAAYEDPRKKARDNKIRAALLEMSNTAKTYGLKFDAPGADAGGRYNTRQPFTKIHVTDVAGRVEVVQIYIKHDGFEW